MDQAQIPDWLVTEVPGAKDLISWFGSWPSFHDAEVISIELVRSGPSRIAVHAFERTRELDPNGFYVCRKHVIVTFLLSGIQSLRLEHFNHQNVLAGLWLTRAEEGYTLELEGCFGADGSIAAESICIEFAPGAPADSQYLGAANSSTT